MESPNGSLADTLYSIGTYYATLFGKFKSDEYKYKSKAYMAASESLRSLSEEVTSGKEAKAAVLSGIGESIQRDIDEYVTTGKISRLETLRSENPDIEEPLRQLMRIHGINVIRAVKLYNSNVRSINDLWNSDLITENERLSVTYLLQLEQKIPRVEMNYIKSIFTDLFQGIYFEIVGSYRRGLHESSDIDVLIRKSQGVTIDLIVNKLGDFIRVVYGKRTEMFLGVIKIDDFNAHRIDILMIEPENWYPALLHFTGSKFFNIRLRSIAKSKGMKLSQHGLFDLVTGNAYPVNSEEDIFRLLGQSYLPPSQRV